MLSSRKKRNLQNTKRQNKRDQKHEWITVEERNAAGQPIFPRPAVLATVNTRFDPEKHTDLNLRIITGVAPEGGIVGQYKIYDITKFSLNGWRIEAQATIELHPARGHEKEWFEAFKGNNAVICDPGLPGTVSEEYVTKIIGSDFSKKVISRLLPKSKKQERRVFEGRLWMKETWRSTLLRRKGQAGRYLVATVIGVLVGVAIKSLF